MRWKLIQRYECVVELGPKTHCRADALHLDSSASRCLCAGSHRSYFGEKDSWGSKFRCAVLPCGQMVDIGERERLSQALRLK